MAKNQPRVTLAAMTEEEFGPYLRASIRDFAKQKIISGEWSEFEAVALSEADFARLLPDGLKSPDQHLYSVRDAESGERVAAIWIALRLKAGRVEGFVYDIEVLEQFRGQGYGRATMLAGIEKARELGAETVGLHVFGHNAPARALYRSLGFVETNVSMSLEL
ncbi:MAG TPA: GNAT family N-acetyltransferase [Actinocrinis sp.]|jgi:ribosomal protein S18 acetylase RimI-like enzyme|uniref:GNAT family N-acetyltransferase n=1 Tax=Actinocrinis sp. TaxID=1920516 RepID=UPI002D273160|nr:GNAT family N-acetyltransferase [Actinocrinis sp.]HZU55004.1 GNAT family N-acetyltransferase [Actinocrinis sp.]